MSDGRPFEGISVLLLEDEVIVLFLHIQTLEELGCRVTGCSTLQEAFHAIRRERPDVALLDVNVHGETSYALAESLERIGIRFGFLTGYSSEHLDPKWQRHPYCEKPCTPGGLWHMISACLARGQAAGPGATKTPD
jgi:CheY-like chemotaxis protein